MVSDGCAEASLIAGRWGAWGERKGHRWLMRDEAGRDLKGGTGKGQPEEKEHQQRQLWRWLEEREA